MSKFAKIVYWIMAIVVAATLGGVLPGVLGASWLAAGADFGLSPTTLDVVFASLTFGISININLCMVILLAIEAVIYVIWNRYV